MMNYKCKNCGHEEIYHSVGYDYDGVIIDDSVKCRRSFDCDCDKFVPDYESSRELMRMTIIDGKKNLVSNFLFLENREYSVIVSCLLSMRESGVGNAALNDLWSNSKY